MNQKLFSQDMSNKIVDSHCHLDFEDFDNDREKVILDAKMNNVDFLLGISVNLEDFEKVHKIALNHENIWCTTGIHPNNVSEKLSSNDLDSLKKKIMKNLNNKKVIGVGETGLDFFRNEKNKINQIECFKMHLCISGENDVPTIVHTRDADNDTLKCIKDAVKNHSSKGLIHCFTSTKNFAKSVLENGFYISFSGIITFKNVNQLIDVIKYVPLDKLLVETDSPYLAPVPFRGKRNQPSYVNYTLEKIAEIKKINKEKLANITTNNFFSLFSST